MLRRVLVTLGGIAALTGGITAAAVVTGFSSAGTFTSFQAAFNAAQPGETITVPDGTYAAQTLTGPAKASAVTFQAQTPGQVKVGSLSVNVDRVHFVGIVAAGTGEARGSLTVCGTASNCPAKFTDVVFDGFRGKSAFIRASYVTVRNSEFGDANACQNLATEDAVRFWGGGGSATPDHDILESSVVHDWRGGSNGTCDGTVSPTPHLDCMQNQGGTNMIIRNNVFYGCPSDNIQMEPFSGASIGNVTVSGNYLGQTGCCNSIVLGATVAGSYCSTLAITGNIYFKQPNLDKCAGQGVTVQGNTICASVTQSGCAIPVPLPAPPPETTTVATTAPPPTTAPYSPACATSCDEQIGSLSVQVQMLQTQAAIDQATITALNSQIAALEQQVSELGGRIKQAILDLGG